MPAQAQGHFMRNFEMTRQVAASARQGIAVRPTMLFHVRFNMAGSRPNPPRVRMVARTTWRRVPDRLLSTFRKAAKATRWSLRGWVVFVPTVDVETTVIS